MDLKQESVELYEDGPNIVEIKDELIEYEVPKFEHCLDYLLQNVDHDSVLENIQVCPTIIVKKELENKNISEVKYNSNVKQEISSKIESELLTTHCDLPTLKDESTEFPDLCGRKHDDRKSNAFNNIGKSKRRYPCPVCQKYFVSSKSRSRHFRKRFVVCEFCGKCMKKTEFLRHNFIHLVKNKNSKVFQIINKQQHLLINSDISSKRFTQKSNLQQHLIIHTHEKPFESHLHKHLIIHAKRKPFKCDICCKEFIQKFHLQQHLTVHSGETPFKCDICYKQFNRKSNLKTHLIIHSGEKPFKCVICCKGFTQKCSYQQHLIVHTGEKLFKCEICSKEFNHSSNLRHHSLIHANEKPFKCDICCKQFTQKSSLQRHLIVIHNNENKKKSS